MSSKGKPSSTSKYAAEFLGTFLLTVIVGLNITSCESDTGFGPIAIGCGLMVLVYTFGPISGGHLNPAVTFAVLLQEKMSPEEGESQWREALKYVIAQCAGGSLAGLACGFMVGFEHSKASLGPTQEVFWLGAPLCEFFYTFMLCFVVLNVAVEHAHTTKSTRESLGDDVVPAPAGYGVAIGFVIIAAKGASFVSGAALNPAVTLGVNFMGPTWKTIYLPIYAAVQLAGGFAATTALHIVRPGSTTHFLKGGSKITEWSIWLESQLDPEDMSELLGTFFVGLTISLNGMVAVNPGAIWSVGASFMCMIYALGPVSGGVFNPALTLAFCLRWYGTGGGFGPEKLCDPVKQGLTSQKEWVKYSLFQLIGAAAGTGVTILVYMMSGQWPAAGVGPACVSPTVNTDPLTCARHTEGQAFFAEALGTFLLCYCVLCIAGNSVSNPLREYAPFCVGSCIIAAGYSFGSISGGLLNPAVTLCNSVASIQVLTSAAPWLYMGAQAIGGALAALVFRVLTHPHEITPAGDATSGQPLLDNTA